MRHPSDYCTEVNIQAMVSGSESDGDNPVRRFGLSLLVLFGIAASDAAWTQTVGTWRFASTRSDHCEAVTAYHSNNDNYSTGALSFQFDSTLHQNRIMLVIIMLRENAQLPIYKMSQDITQLSINIDNNNGINFPATVGTKQDGKYDLIIVEVPQDKGILRGAQDGDLLTLNVTGFLKIKLGLINSGRAISELLECATKAGGHNLDRY